MGEPLIRWYRENRRDLPWRQQPSPYHVWVSEIMLQQTRVEAVKPYYQRFLAALPAVKDLAEVPEDQLLKLWEGLGYYNRVRNMQKAARQVMADYGGEFPVTYEGIRSLAGIGSYTAGAIASFAYGLPKPAVDGNVLRVIMRLTGDDSDIMKQSTKKQVEENLEPVIPADAASDFNQGLIELGAMVCVPNGQPKCGACPLAGMCRARMEGRIEELPVKTRAKERRIEERTILVFRDGEKTAICKRPDKGLLAGMYELPNYLGHMSRKEVAAYSKEIGLMPVRIKKLPEAKHIFSHVEWHMTGYEVRVDELEKTNEKGFLFIHPEEIQERYPIPAAFGSYLPRS
ncbi:A/G-specific adenine glycosylase [Massilistercora timonensis]|uniref:A/G-specific adenine glycosylase n=1 Tax=Massilistercora timonensis TaxID=2086584 RepID=UPI003AB65012